MNPNTIEAVVDIVVYERGSNVEHDYIQISISYGIEAKSKDIFDKVIEHCKEARGDKFFYRIKSILKWNI